MTRTRAEAGLASQIETASQFAMKSTGHKSLSSKDRFFVELLATNIGFNLISKADHFGGHKNLTGDFI
jgi:hypothetical protein